MEAASPPETLRLILTHIRGVRDLVDGASFQEFSTVYVAQMAVDGAVLANARALRQLPPDLLGRHSQVEWQGFQTSAQMVTNGQADTDARFRLATCDIPP